MDTEKLIERLRAVESSASDFVGDPNPRYVTCWYRNPDGPEAADALEASTRREREMREIVEAFVDIEAGTDTTGFTPTVEQMLMDLAAEARTTLSQEGL